MSGALGEFVQKDDKNFSPQKSFVKQVMTSWYVDTVQEPHLMKMRQHDTLAACALMGDLINDVSHQTLPAQTKYSMPGQTATSGEAGAFSQPKFSLPDINAVRAQNFSHLVPGSEQTSQLNRGVQS